MAKEEEPKTVKVEVIPVEFLLGMIESLKIRVTENKAYMEVEVTEDATDTRGEVPPKGG